MGGRASTGGRRRAARRRVVAGRGCLCTCAYARDGECELASASAMRTEVCWRVRADERMRACVRACADDQAAGGGCELRHGQGPARVHRGPAQARPAQVRFLFFSCFFLSAFFFVRDATACLSRAARRLTAARRQRRRAPVLPRSSPVFPRPSPVFPQTNQVPTLSAHPNPVLPWTSPVLPPPTPV